MAFLSLLAALVLEQLRPLDARRYVLAPGVRFADFLAARFDDTRAASGVLAWCLAAGLPVLVTGGVYALLDQANPAAGWALNVLVLYLTMGLRQFSHFFTDIHLALRMGELDRVRALLGEWRGSPIEVAGAKELARLSIEQAILHSYRYVFAVIFWFVLLPGPMGAVLYRLASILDARWSAAASPGFARFARRAAAAIDWLPQRLTAVCFAVVGNFEDALYCWRTRAAGWADPASGILLASASGALGVRLGSRPAGDEMSSVRGGSEIGEEADVEFLRSTIGLIWRTLVLLLLLALLAAVAGWAAH
ncbi:MAG: CobD/CbiB family protein [Rhodocyclaceae bacterium]